MFNEFRIGTTAQTVQRTGYLLAKYNVDMISSHQTKLSIWFSDTEHRSCEEFDLRDPCFDIEQVLTLLLSNSINKAYDFFDYILPIIDRKRKSG